MSAHTREFVMVERRALRERAEEAIERLVALLDELDGDVDVEVDDFAEDETDHRAEWGL